MTQRKSKREAKVSPKTVKMHSKTGLGARVGFGGLKGVKKVSARTRNGPLFGSLYFETQAFRLILLSKYEFSAVLEND